MTSGAALEMKIRILGIVHISSKKKQTDPQAWGPAWSLQDYPVRGS